MTDPIAVARQLRDAYADRRLVPTPSSQDDRFDIAAAYAIERELARMRSESGHTAVGRKVGFANKAMWRALKLDTLVWARMYDDTVRDAPSGETTISIARMVSPKIEPEIVVKLRAPVRPGAADAAAALDAVEWIALGFEIIDCVYPDWKFGPADFVAAYGLHAALVVGPARAVDDASIPKLAEELAVFNVRLLKNGEVVEEGSGKNALRSPALCLAELSAAIARQSGAEPLAAGELVSTGTLTNSAPIAAGDTWRAEVDGLDVAPLTVRVS